MAVEAFRGFKGDVENLLAVFAGDVSYDRETAEYFHPGRSARALMNRTVVAQFGQIHPDIAAARKLRQDVFLAEIDLEQLYKIGLRPVRFEPLAKYPAVERDFSFVFADEVTFEQIQRAVDNTAIPELREFRPVEIFRGGAIPSGKYSVLLRAKFQSAERTLREDEVAQWSAKDSLCPELARRSTASLTRILRSLQYRLYLAIRIGTASQAVPRSEASAAKTKA